MKILISVAICLALSGCMLGVGTSEPTGEANMMGITSKKKMSEVSVIAGEIQASLSAIQNQPGAFAQPTCNPELTEMAEMACVIGNSIALAVAYALNRPTTAAGEIAYAGAESIRASADGLTRRSQARWSFARIMGAGYFAAKTAEVIGDANAAIASTVATNGGVRVGTINQSSSRHGSAAPGGEGEGGSAAAGHAGDSLNQLTIGNNNSSAIGQDSARIAGQRGIVAEPSATVATFSDSAETKGSPVADELQAPVNFEDNDGNPALF